MIPQSGIGGEKSKLAQARLQEVCCFSAPFALRLHPSSSLSVLIRVIRGQNAFRADSSRPYRARGRQRRLRGVGNGQRRPEAG